MADDGPGQRGLGRRKLLALGGALGAGAALGGAATPGWGAERAGHGAAALAELPDAGRFDLRAEPGFYFEAADSKYRVPLHNSTVMQTFGFDTVNQEVYTLQVIQGGLGSDPDNPIPGQQRLHDGDLCITRLSLGGTKLGHMYVRGFGHGGYMGVEPAGSGGAWLWTEYASEPVDMHPPHPPDVEDEADWVGYGTKIARYRFVDGAVADIRFPGSLDRIGLTEHTPTVPDQGSLVRRSPRAVIDPRHQNLAVRYSGQEAGTDRVAVYSLADARRNEWRNPLQDVEVWRAGKDETTQGFAVFGRYMYQLHGTAYCEEGRFAGCSERPSGNTKLTCVDLRTGKVVGDRFLTTAFKSLPYREPEGMAIDLAYVQGREEPRLCFGFASSPSRTVHHPRLATIAYKGVLV